MASLPSNRAIKIMSYGDDWFELHAQAIMDRARVFSEYSSGEERIRIDHNVLSAWLRQFENEYRGIEAAWRLVERIDFFPDDVYRKLFGIL